ncbi:MAG: hypothetical protein R2744_01760 [Bacteroidales bacterium]
MRFLRLIPFSGVNDSAGILKSLSTRFQSGPKGTDGTGYYAYLKISGVRPHMCLLCYSRDKGAVM